MPTYTGGCHCKKVKYEVETDLGMVIQCNCSNCGMRSLLLNFVPVENFKLIAGQDELKDYQFNKHIIHHYFCGNCGVESFGAGIGPDGKEMRAINARCLEGVEVESLKLTPFNGRDT